MRMVRHQTTQCLQRLFRPIFLNESDGDHDCDGEGNADCIVIVSHEKGDRSGGQKEEDQGLLKLLEKAEPDGLWFFVREFVGSLLCQAHLGLGGIKAMDEGGL